MIPTERRLAAMVLIILVAGTAACLWTAVQEDRHMRDQLLTQAKLAVVGMPVEEISALTGSEKDLLLPGYRAMKNQMTGLRVADADIRFTYLIGHRNDGTYFFFVDSEPESSEDYSPPGQEYPEVTDLIRNVYTGGIPLTAGPDTDRWGTWVSSSVPVVDPRTGTTIAVFGIDVDARNWYWQILIACLPPLTATILILMLILHFSSLHDRSERGRRRTLLFLNTQQALVEMAKLPSDCMEQYLRNLIVIDARTLGADRVSIWMFSEDHSEMVCAEGYLHATNTFSSGMRLSRSDYPRYFTALDEDRIIAAEDARTDELTREFADTYLVPLNIVSMLDVPIRRGGRPVGIICHEYTGSKRSWDLLEQDFAASAADLVASAFERADRIAAEQALAESERRYRGVVEDQTELITRFLPDRTLVFVNPAYCRFFSVDRDHILGTAFDPALTEADTIQFASLLASLSQSSPVAEITTRCRGGTDHTEQWVRWIVRAIFSKAGAITEYQAVGRDISWQKQIEEALSLTNRKLGLLSSITRHDVLNQIIILKGFLQLAEELRDQPELFALYIEKTYRAIATIEAQINFTKTYQDMGSIAPSWQDVSLCIVRAKGALPAADIRTELHHTGLEVFADPLLEKVFYNLFDNALRYGGPEMTAIHVRSEDRQEGLVITCEDDGEGIHEQDKTRLFTQGFGKNTGFGLFLSREILAISGITIQETGIPGQGARFEIFVPAGSFRFRENGHTDEPQDT